ncbi:MAG: hypothetical protein A3K19_29680 [Lentisphaerae bacterium RIFOXYB12_FULL_65_16]|nr:MAG: hypothetical protein A3K18_33290 [Lentisphaerae bacterium RIFOXYA12_64_32]OGV86499.1 MAG: hypothetical protein A3K19_29680 [Lentisphaerae bacterium RIFOXYB12_FULL_65_16]
MKKRPDPETDRPADADDSTRPIEDDTGEPVYDPPRRNYSMTLDYDDGVLGDGWTPSAATKAELRRLVSFILRIEPNLQLEIWQNDEPEPGSTPIESYGGPIDHEQLRGMRYHILHGMSRAAAEDDRRIAELKVRCLAVIDGTNDWRLYDALEEKIVLDLDAEAAGRARAGR